MQALIELPSPGNTLPALQLLYDYVEGNIGSLQSLRIPQQQYGSMLVLTTLKKLSPDTCRNLTRSHGNDQRNLTEL